MEVRALLKKESGIAFSGRYLLPAADFIYRMVISAADSAGSVGEAALADAAGQAGAEDPEGRAGAEGREAGTGACAASVCGVSAAGGFCKTARPGKSGRKDYRISASVFHLLVP